MDETPRWCCDIASTSVAGCHVFEPRQGYFKNGSNGIVALKIVGFAFRLTHQCLDKMVSSAGNKQTKRREITEQLLKVAFNIQTNKMLYICKLNLNGIWFVSANGALLAIWGLTGTPL